VVIGPDSVRRRSEDFTAQDVEPEPQQDIELPATDRLDRLGWKALGEPLRDRLDCDGLDAFEQWRAVDFGERIVQPSVERTIQPLVERVPHELALLRRAEELPQPGAPGDGPLADLGVTCRCVPDDQCQLGEVAGTDVLQHRSESPYADRAIEEHTNTQRRFFGIGRAIVGREQLESTSSQDQGYGGVCSA
jgi:hypothetical protein